MTGARIPLGYLTFIVFAHLLVKVWTFGGTYDDERQGVVSGIVKIPCPFKDGKVKAVSWFKDDVSNGIYNFDASNVLLVKGSHHPNSDANYNPLSSPSNLILENLKLEDEGLFMCYIEYESSPSTFYITFLKIIEPPGPIRFLDESKVEIDTKSYGPIRENSTVEITCEVEGGRPQPNITWWDGGNLLDGIIDASNGSVIENSLTIPSISRENHGQILECQTANSDLTSYRSKKLILDVQYPPLTAEIVTLESPLVAEEVYKIRCQGGDARPPAYVTWYLDGSPLESADDYTDESGKTMSTILFVPSDHDGGKRLECKAQSPVIEHHPPTHFWILDIHYRPNVNLSMIPAGDVKEGDEVTFVCDSEANPPATNISWLYKKREMNPLVMPRTAVTENSLLLSSVTRNMSGIYSCVAENIVEEGHSIGIFLHIRHRPVCNTEDIQLLGASINENTSIFCNVKASPGAISYRWHFNSSNQTYQVEEESIATELPESRLNYTPTHNSHFGTFKCWAMNEIGEQEEPCVFKLVEASYPEEPQNCTFVKNFTSSTVFVECMEGHDGGLPQVFVAELMNLADMTLERNVSTEDPYFNLDELPSGTDFQMTIYSANARGPSKKSQKLQVYTAFTLNIPYWPPILGVLIGVVGALVIVSLIIGFVMCLRSNSARTNALDSYDEENGSPLSAKDGETEPEEGGFPTKFKHANIYETVSYDSSEEANRGQIPRSPETKNEGKDNVEYAELNFSKGKTKAKKPKSKKRSSNSNGKIHSTHEPTLYASIDYVQTEKQQLMAKEKDSSQPKQTLQSLPTQTTQPPQSFSSKPHSPLYKNGLKSPTKPLAPSIPSQPTTPASNAPLPPSPPPPLPLTSTSSTPAKPRDAVLASYDTSTPCPSVPDETESQKATGKPTNLDKPAIPKKPSFPSDSSKKRSAETQTTPTDVRDTTDNSALIQTPKTVSYPGTITPEVSKEDIPLMDTSAESSL